MIITNVGKRKETLTLIRKGEQGSRNNIIKMKQKDF